MKLIDNSRIKKLKLNTKFSDLKNSQKLVDVFFSKKINRQLWTHLLKKYFFFQNVRYIKNYKLKLFNMFSILTPNIQVKKLKNILLSKHLIVQWKSFFDDLFYDSQIYFRGTLINKRLFVTNIFLYQLFLYIKQILKYNQEYFKKIFMFRNTFYMLIFFCPILLSTKFNYFLINLKKFYFFNILKFVQIKNVS